MKIKRMFIILAVIIFQTSCSQPDKTTLEGIEGLNTLPNNYFFELVNRFPLKSDLVKKCQKFYLTDSLKTCTFAKKKNYYEINWIIYYKRIRKHLLSVLFFTNLSFANCSKPLQIRDSN